MNNMNNSITDGDNQISPNKYVFVNNPNYKFNK